MTPIPRLILPVALFLLTTCPGLGQSGLDSLENIVDDLYGIDKLRVLHEIIPLCLARQDDRKALRYAGQAERLTEDIINQSNQLLRASDYLLRPATFYWLGRAYQQRGQYLESKDAYQTALREANDLEATEWRRQAQLALYEIDSIAAAADKIKKPFLGGILRDMSSAIDDASRDLSVNATLKVARLHENNGNLPRAIEQYTLAANLLQNKGDWEREEEIREIIAGLMTQSGQLEEAQAAYEAIRETKMILADSIAAAEIESRLGEIEERVRRAGGAPFPPPAVLKLPPQEIEITRAENNLRDIRRSAERAESSQDYKTSLDYYKQYLALEQRLAEEKRLQELALLEQAHEIENRDREVLLLKQNEEISQLQLEQKETELQKQVAFKRNLFMGVLLLGGLGFTLFLLYHNKRRDHRKLGAAFDNRTRAQDRLKAAEQRVKTLLDQHVSGAVADELLAAKGDGKVERRFVCVMFLDIRDFTPFAEKLSPEEIIEYQNKVFGFMIDTINKHGGILNQIMGDGFMATFGAPVTAGNDCLEAYLAAQEIMDELNARSASGDIPPTRVGIGLHAGYVVTGNVGTADRKQYSITGNPVIIAARLEQLNKEFGSTLVVSKDVYDRLPESVRLPAKFNDVNVKGRSEPVAVAFF